MDIFKMANEIAKNMSLDDKDGLDNMDMGEMISHVTKNVLNMMNNGNFVPPQPPSSSSIPNDNGENSSFQFPGMPAGFDPTAMFNAFQQQQRQQPQSSSQESILQESEDDEENCIYTKTRDICFDLNVDLEDFYTGKKKKLNVKRKRIIEVDGKQ